MKTFFHLFFFSLASLSIAGCNDVSNSNSKPNSESGKTLSEDNRPVILFFGDSLTAGYGVADPDQVWTARVEKMLEKDGYAYRCVNAGLSGDTTSGGLARLDWVLQMNPKIFVLELGANDSMRGVPISEIQKNLEAIIQRVRKKNPDTKILLLGMKTFPNLGKEYRSQFDSIFPKIADQTKVSFVPFLLEGVAGDRKLNQPDGIHPTGEGHAILASNVYPFLKKLL